MKRCYKCREKETIEDIRAETRAKSKSKIFDSSGKTNDKSYVCATKSSDS